MRLADLSRTTSFRLAVAFLALFGASSLALFAFISVEVNGFLVARVDEWATREGRSLATLDPERIQRRLAARERDDIAAERPMALFDADGRHVAGAHVALPPNHAQAPVPFDFAAREGPGPRAPLRGVVLRLPSGQFLLVAQNVEELREFREVLSGAMLLAGGVTAGLGLAGAALIGAGAVRRIDDITLATRGIMKGDLSRRLPSRGETGDIGRLVAVVNEMLDEIQRLLHEVKGVCDNIAHDMRTPLTRLLAGLDRSRRRSTSIAEYEESVDDAIRETQGILQTFAALLRISEIEDGARRTGFVEIDVGSVAADAVELYEPVADDRSVTLAVHHGGAEGPPFRGDPNLLFEAFANLVDNAVKFTPPGGRVEVRVVRDARSVEVSVGDTGPGIAPDERTRVLQRFYRTEQSRHDPGNGLGLSLVAAIARLHGFELSISEPPGCVVTLRYESPT